MNYSNRYDLQFVRQELKVREEEFKKMKYRSQEEIKVCEIAREGSTFEPFHKYDVFVGRDAYATIRFEITFDVPTTNEKLVLLGDLGETCNGHNSGFEAIVYVDGTLLRSLDQNHAEITIPSQYYGKQCQVEIRLWSGLEGGGEEQDQVHMYRYLGQAILNETMNEFVYLLQALNESIQYFKGKELEAKLVVIGEQLLKKMDFTLPCANINEHIITLIDWLKLEFSNVSSYQDVSLYMSGHTHIDVAWLWRLKHTAQKCERSFSNVLALFEEYPEYKFFQSQPALYELLRKQNPEMFEKIKLAIQKGQWEPGGAMWVESDCNLISGESIIRQILYGKRYFKKEFGVETDYLWLVDVFGYSWALPQILRKANIATFLTSKISWNQYNKIPADTFEWIGIDGSKVLTQFISTPEVGRDENDIFVTYNGKSDVRGYMGTWDKYTSKDVSSIQLIPYGHGDGGGGTTRDMLDRLRAYESMPFLPKVKHATPSTFFQALHQEVANKQDELVTWDGELYLEYHRGTYTSQAHIKKWNRFLENYYRKVEMLGVMSLVYHNQYPSIDLEDGYRKLLVNQFHDILPGSSIREVYEDAVEDYQVAYDVAKQFANQALENLTQDEKHSMVIVNDSAQVRSDFLWLDEPETYAYEYAGKTYQSYVYDKGTVLYLDAIEPTSISSIKRLERITTNLTTFNVTAFETRFYDVQMNDNGEIISLVDKETQRELTTDRLNYFELFEDRPMQFDAWDIDIYHFKKPLQAAKLSKREVICANDLIQVIRQTYRLYDSEIVQDIIFNSKNKRIDFKTSIDWHQQRQVLKVAFDVNIRNVNARYDIQCGSVLRPTHRNTSWDLAKFEVVAHKWMDLSESNYGVAILNDAKYGHAVCGSKMTLTLLKGAVYPDVNADQGKHQFTYSIYPHDHDCLLSDVEKQAFNLNNPLLCFKDKTCRTQSLFQSMSDYVMVDAIKKAEDSEDYIVRLHEYRNQRGTLDIPANFNYTSKEEVNLLEETYDGNVDTISPFEIKTIRFGR